MDKQGPAAGEEQRIRLLEEDRAAWVRLVKKKNGSSRQKAPGRPAITGLWLRIGAALERRAIVVGAVGIVAGGLLLGLLGFRAQGGLAGRVVRNLARKHDVAQAALHGIEFGSGDNVFLPRREDAGDFLLRVFDALRRRRMRGENLGDRAGAALFVSLDALEEGHVSIGVVAGFVHVLQAEEIGFTFGVAAELQVGHGNREVQSLIKAIS